MRNWRVPFGNLEISEDSRKLLNDSANRDWASEGQYVRQFEEEWGKLFGYECNIMVTSGTLADVITCEALHSLNSKRSLDLRDNQVIVPALGFSAAGASIIYAGFEPVFVDIEKETMNINPSLIESAITDKTRAIMAIHTMGRPCEMDKIMSVARKHRLYVIEDSCEAHGARYKGKFIGQWGDAATFSYYAAHIICCGEGGMISTNRKEIANNVRSIKSHGRKPDSLYFNHERLGLNGKTTDLAAAVGFPQLKDFWDIFNKRKENLLYLLEKTKDLERFAWFTSEREGETISPHAFSVTLKNPEYDLKALSDFLENQESGIQCKRNFGSMPTQHEAYRFLGYRLGDFPNAEYVGDNGLHFGIHQFLTREDLDFVSDRLHEYFDRFKYN